MTVPLADAVAALQEMFRRFSGKELPEAKAIELIQSQSRANFDQLVNPKK